MINPMYELNTARPRSQSVFLVNTLNSSKLFERPWLGLQTCTEQGDICAHPHAHWGNRSCSNVRNINPLVVEADQAGLPFTVLLVYLGTNPTCTIKKIKNQKKPSPPACYGGPSPECTLLGLLLLATLPHPSVSPQTYACSHLLLVGRFLPNVPLASLLAL